MKSRHCLTVIVAGILLSCSTRNNSSKLGTKFSDSSIKDKLEELKDPSEKKDNNLSADQILQKHLIAIGDSSVSSKIRTLYEKLYLIGPTDTIIEDNWYFLGQKSRLHRVAKQEINDMFLTRECAGCSLYATFYPGQNKQGAVGLMAIDTTDFAWLLYGQTYYQMPGLVQYVLNNKITAHRTDPISEPYYQVHFTLKNNRYIILDIDPINFMVVGSYTYVYKTNLSEGLFTSYEDFDSTKEGYKYPRKQVSYRIVGLDSTTMEAVIDEQQSIEIADMEFNPVIADSAFKIPPSVQRTADIVERKGRPFPYQTYQSLY